MLTPIEKFNEIFSEKNVNAMTEMVIKRQKRGVKKSNVLDYLAVAHGYSDYQTALGLWNKKNEQQRYWCAVDEDNDLLDEDYSILKTMAQEEKEAFVELYGDRMIAGFNYCYNTKNGLEYPALTDHCFTKDEVIKILQKNNVIYFEYEQSDCNGNPFFEYLIEAKDVDLMNKITSEVYQCTIEELEKDFDIMDFENHSTLSQRVKWLKERNKW